MHTNHHQSPADSHAAQVLKYGARLFIVIGMLLSLTCCGRNGDTRHRHLPQPADYPGGGYYQSPGGKYAAEILSYMMQVVVGSAGDPANRKAWQTRSLSTALDLKEVGNIMRDPGRKMTELMVYDANILGLSRVLYHYNERLNYFKGQSFQESVYPSEELLAMRLFMVQKIAKGEKVRMGSLMRRSSLLDTPYNEPSPLALSRVNLSAQELQLLRDVIDAEPFFKGYLEDPFLVEALYRVNVVEMDGYVRDKIASADYSRLANEYQRQSGEDNGVRVAILPSLLDSFDFQDRITPGFPMGFRAQEDYSRAAETLRRKLKKALRQQVTGFLETDGEAVISPEAREKRVADIVDTHLRFMDFDKRPLVVYPGNAGKVVRSLCPDADFTFILLGKNVYLSMYIDAARDIFPAVNWIYLDLMDVGQSQSDYEIEQAGEYLFGMLKDQIP